MKETKSGKRAALPLCGLACCALALVSSPAQTDGSAPDLALTLRVEEFPAEADRADPAVAAVFRALAKPEDKAGQKYEEQALASVEDLLSKKQIPQQTRLLAAQKILVAVLRWHKLNRDPTGKEQQLWTRLDFRLHKMLYQVRRDLLNHMAERANDESSWKSVFAFADRLRSVYPRDRILRVTSGRLRLRQAEALLTSKRFPEAFAAWQKAAHFIPFDPDAKKTEVDLRKEAKRIQEQAKASQNQAAAITLLQKALAIYPWLPGLRDDLMKRQGKYRILWVAVRQLPEKLSPATAFTDVEKQCRDLIFEPLLRPEYTSAGQEYRPTLAATLPDAGFGGRNFVLSPEARWSDGRRLTAFDIRHTIDLLSRSGSPDRIVWTEQVQVSRPVQPFRAAFRLRRPTLDPLRLFTFPILPRSYRGKPLKSTDDEDFAKSPIGSGPYRYAGRQMVGETAFAQFSANPYFARSDRARQPFIREIRLAVPDGKSPSVPGHESRFHLWLDLTEEQTAWLATLGSYQMRTLPSRRINFLAVNHRRPILQNADLRRALAAAINREAVLNRCFRGKNPAHDWLETVGSGAAAAANFLSKSQGESHRPVNGIFPPGSWAAAPPTRVPARLYDKDKARAFFRRAFREIEKATITLKYDNTDPRLQSTCRLLAAQISAAAADAEVDLTIQPVGLSTHQFRSDLQNADYDLAYAGWHFDTEFYRIWPLFDPNSRANLLGYTNDAVLVGLLRRRMTTSDFRLVRALSHDIHGHLNEKMPLIPLWQLDSHIAVHTDLHLGRADGAHVFAHCAEWTLK